MIPREAVEQLWPQANPYAATWFVDDRAYWTSINSLFEWPLAGGEVRVTELPGPGNWYNVAVNQRYVFVAMSGCRRIRRIERATGEVREASELVTPRADGGPTLYASETRLYCALQSDGRLWSVNVDFEDVRMHVDNDPGLTVRLSLADDGYLYFSEDFPSRGRVSRMHLESERIELLFEGKGWAMSLIRRLDERRVAWLSPQTLRVVNVQDRTLQEFPRQPYFSFGEYSTPGVELLFDAENVYWYRVAEGGHLMVTPRSYFGI